MNSVSKALLGGAFAAVFASGAAAAFLEAQPFFHSGWNGASRLDELLEGNQLLGLSTFAKAYSLRDCDAALTSPYGRMQPQERRTRAAEVCLAAGRQVADRNPANGQALVVAARSAAMLGHIADATRLLRNSSFVTPYELWIAERRVQVVWEWNLFAETELVLIHRRDIAGIGTSSSGREWLARWYLIRPELRETIVSAIDQLSEADRRAFLEVVRAVAASM